MPVQEEDRRGLRGPEEKEEEEEEGISVSKKAELVKSIKTAEK